MSKEFVKELYKDYTIDILDPLKKNDTVEINRRNQLEHKYYKKYKERMESKNKNAWDFEWYKRQLHWDAWCHYKWFACERFKTLIPFETYRKSHFSPSNPV